MLECIQAGAADYLLQPLRPDVIKTLFLVGFERVSVLKLTLYTNIHFLDTS
jgi:hypothetical protein